jgi:hypothetical protein
MNVIVSYICPPIPIRSMDWEARMDNHDDNENTMRGHGITKLAAMENLLEQFDGDEPEARAIWDAINRIERQW